jgi:hypothetical protein
MSWRLATLGALVALAVASCEHDAASPSPAPGSCVWPQFLHIHLVFDPPSSISPVPDWTDPGPLLLTTVGGGTVANDVTPDQLGDDRIVVVALDYPPGTVEGTASIAFYASSGGVAQWVAEPLTFRATPSFRS